MPDYCIRSMQPDDAGAVFDLQAAYARSFPGVSVFPGEMYLSPAFRGGEDVFCALEGQRLLAYAPFYLQPVQNDSPGGVQIAWIEIKADPALDDAAPVKDALGARIAARLNELATGMPPIPVRLTFEYAMNEGPAVSYALSRGFRYLESVYHMRRDLTAPLPALAPPDGVTLRRWKMETFEEQRAYVAARSACFPEAPIPLETWQYYMTSPQWAAGTVIAGFDAGSLVGAVNVYWSEEENAHLPPGQAVGDTEDIFVLPPWRGRGTAGAMIVEAMRYLKERGMAQARLAVRGANENALHLYRALGYTVESESRFYARTVDLAAQGAFTWGA